MIPFLQKYLTINTSQPNPDYTAVCALFRAQAESDGFLYNEILLPSGKPVIVITYQGTEPSLPSLILNHHMDVVPALNSEKWTLPPFAGAIDNEIIIGRGVQDMKGVGVAHYCALQELRNAGVQFARTVHIVAVPDEEIGGFTGTKQFIETDFFKAMNCGFVIDEGIPSGDTTTLALKVTERKPLQIQITVTGSLAHGSQLNCFNAIHELVTILNKVTTHHQAQQQKSITQADGLLLSMNITSLTAGMHSDNKICLNMVPDYASATVDIRVPPTMLMHEAVTMIEDILQHHTNSSYTVHAIVSEQNDSSRARPEQFYPHLQFLTMGSPVWSETKTGAKGFSSSALILQQVQDERKKTDKIREEFYKTFLYNSIENAIKQYGLQSQPLFFEGSSDLRYYKALNIDGVGFTPFTVANAIHCTNESLPIADLIQGKNIMVHFLKNFCITKENTNG
jgi:N-acyl-L-amino-acid amidohydrolase